MSGLVLVCILPERRFPGTDVAFAAPRPLSGLAVHTLTLWIRSASHAPVATLEEVRAHHGDVEAAWRENPAVLPVRFGQWFASESDLRAAVEPRAEEYARCLERVAGAAEFSIRILDPSLEVEEAPAPRAGTGTGTDYLRAAAGRARGRARAIARGREVAAEMRSALGRLVREDRVEPPATPHELATVAHLVARADEAEWAERVAAFGAERPALELLRTGPWPPWSFTA